MPNVLITGAGGQLGTAVTTAFEAAGWTTATASRPDYDLANDAGAAAAVSDAGDIDALAHLVGGFAAGRPVAETPFEEFKAMWDLNVGIAYRVAHHAVRAMRPGGAIVLVSSASASKPFAGAAGYCSSKAAVVPLARVIDLEGTRCNAIVPTMIGPQGTPAEDIARVVVWLCSPESAAVRGAAVPV